MNRNEEAAAAFQRSLDSARRSYGPKHWLTGFALGGLSTAQQNLGHLPAALRYDQQALATFEACCGPDSVYVATILINTGEVLRLQHRPAEALQTYQRALALQEKTIGPDHSDVAYCLIGIAESLLELGRSREAIAAGERSLILREGKPLNPTLVEEARFVLARALWNGGGDRARAIHLSALARQGFAAGGRADDQREVEDWLRQRRQTW